jgi:hypothetical protein
VSYRRDGTPAEALGLRNFEIAQTVRSAGTQKTRKNIAKMMKMPSMGDLLPRGDASHHLSEDADARGTTQLSGLVPRPMQKFRSHSFVGFRHRLQKKNYPEERFTNQQYVSAIKALVLMPPQVPRDDLLSTAAQSD